jgi:predicted RNase H-like HicB family nuclease
MKLCVRIIQDEGGGYTAFCPSLPGCKSRGKSREEAREKLDDAIRGYVAAMSDFIPENLLEEIVEV